MMYYIELLGGPEDGREEALDHVPTTIKAVHVNLQTAVNEEDLRNEPITRPILYLLCGRRVTKTKIIHVYKYEGLQ